MPKLTINGQEVELPGNHHVELEICSDGRMLGIAVGDPFGSISPQLVLEYLSNCLRDTMQDIEHKDGGAGLGIASTFAALSHFVVNIDPGRRTEALGLIDIRGRFRDFAKRAKSFNVFVQQGEVS